jgi:hypothetical protein
VLLAQVPWVLYSLLSSVGDDQQTRCLKACGREGEGKKNKNKEVFLRSSNQLGNSLCQEFKACLGYTCSETLSQANKGESAWSSEGHTVEEGDSISNTIPAFPHQAEFK